MKVGIIGGTGQLGSALAKGMLQAGVLNPDQLCVSNRSGELQALSGWPAVRCTADNAELAAGADVVFLSVPPGLFSTLQLDLSSHLIISVMAGITVADIGAATGARRIARAMSSPAAAQNRAFSPWYAAGLSDEDQQCVDRLLASCGLADQLAEEDLVNQFTALTGPVPGFVAYFAAAVQAHAVQQGIPPAIAERAIKQLFLASGELMAGSPASPQAFVDEMIDYAGVTAAGMLAMNDLDVPGLISRGFDAAYARTQTIGAASSSPAATETE